MLTDKMKSVGLTNTNTHTMYRGEMIYIQDGLYYPTIMNGYKDATCCISLEDAHKWIEEKNKP